MRDESKTSFHKTSIQQYDEAVRRRSDNAEMHIGQAVNR